MKNWTTQMLRTELNKAIQEREAANEKGMKALVKSLDRKIQKISDELASR